METENKTLGATDMDREPPRKVTSFGLKDVELEKGRLFSDAILIQCDKYMTNLFAITCLHEKARDEM